MEEGKVYTIKLNSGEELIAKFIGTQQGGYIAVSNPVSIAPGPQGMGLVPSLFTANPSTDVSINSNSIAMYVETDDAVVSKYIQATTGIAVPDKKIVMG